jgi:hypothetical protein
MYFKRTSLFAMGFILQLGHGGGPCPPASGTGSLKRKHGKLYEETETDDDDDNEEWFDEDEGAERHMKKKHLEPGVVVVVDRAGVFKHRVHWCSCVNAPARHIQLLQMGLYPGSISRPRTAFTFSLLNYFYMDAMECRTAASNFFNKLRRLTNDAFPSLVFVSVSFLIK